MPESQADQLPTVNETRISISNELDIVDARQKGKDLAVTIGFSGADLTVIATAISEITRNIVTYAGSGELILGLKNLEGRFAIEIVAIDKGPGIADLSLAMKDGYSTRNSLGLGLPGAKRLMDEFEIETNLGIGTKVTMRKWVR